MLSTGDAIGGTLDPMRMAGSGDSLGSARPVVGEIAGVITGTRREIGNGAEGLLRATQALRQRAGPRATWPSSARVAPRSQSSMTSS